MAEITQRSVIAEIREFSAVISATQYKVVSKTSSDVEKEIRKYGIGVKKLHKIVSKIYGNLPVFPICPELILYMDETVN